MKGDKNMYKLTIVYERNGKEFALTCQMEDMDELTAVLAPFIESVTDYQYHVKRVVIE